MFSLKGLFVSVVLVCASFQFSIANAYWQDIDPHDLNTAARGDQPVMLRTEQGRYLNADIESLRQALLNNDSVDIDIPLPNGEMAVYRLELSPIAAQGLLDKFPEIRTFRGVDVDNEANSGRFDISPLGFRGMFRHDGERLLIDPQYMNDDGLYVSYSAKHARPTSEQPREEILYTDLLNSAAIAAANRDLPKGSSDGQLRTYRLAVATTREYTNFHGGDVSDGIAAVITAVNRVNIIFETDLNIRLVLIENNDLIIFTDSNPGGYSGGISGTPSFDLFQNEDNLEDIIGLENFDIGHLLGTRFGGSAALAGVCFDLAKARGLTGLSNPVGDVFYVDYFAHEIGHQFGANHTFNGTSSGCGGLNRNSSTAYEPGSGATIMGYAGICGGENLQSNSDSYFHSGTIAEIRRFVQTGIFNNNGTLLQGAGNTCGTILSSGSDTPNAVAGIDLTIPANTPFVLVGSATDNDNGDILTYTWEQLDVGAATSSQAEWVDNGDRAIFRSLKPSSSPIRYFPNLPDVLDGSLEASKGEAYPTTNRDLNFRFTVRDGSGETAYEDRVISVTTSAGPFLVTSPSAVTWNTSSANISWDVANTSSMPVNCSNVNISLSTDSGGEFAYNLTPTPVANNGSANISVPFVDSSEARIMVMCADNVFYAVNSGNFSISRLVTPVSAIDDVNITEGGPLIFPVSLSSTLVAPRTYSYTIQNISTSNADVTGVSFSAGVTDNGDGTLTVPSGVSSFNLIINTIDDSLVEPTEQLKLYLGGLSADASISDNDVVVSSVSDTEAREGESLRFSIDLSASTTANQQFSFSLSNISSSVTDYSTLSFSDGVSDNGGGNLLVPSGLLSFQIILPILQDNIEEGLETVRLTVAGKSGIGTIVDEDVSGNTGNPVNNNSSSSSGGGAIGFTFIGLYLLAFIAVRRMHLC